MRITGDLSTHEAEKRHPRFRRAKPYVKNMYDHFAGMSAWSLRQWKATRSGQEYRLDGWWKRVNCRQCGRLRYSYPTVGVIYRNTDPYGRVEIVGREFSKKGHNGIVNELMPPDSTKPPKQCICSVRP